MDGGGRRRIAWGVVRSFLNKFEAFADLVPVGAGPRARFVVLAAVAAWGTACEGETAAQVDAGPAPAVSSAGLSRSVDCKTSDGCSQHGRCAERDGQCIAVSDDDCRASEWCRGVGRCSASEGKCVAGKDSDCRRGRMCATLGKCTARDGLCVVGSSTDCLESEHCKRFGRCSVRNDVCAITSNEDCKRSELCTLGGQCRAKRGDQVWECVD